MDLRKSPGDQVRRAISGGVVDNAHLKLRNRQTVGENFLQTINNDGSAVVRGDAESNQRCASMRGLSDHGMQSLHKRNASPTLLKLLRHRAATSSHSDRDARY